MLRALLIVGFVSSCAPVSALAPAAPVTPTASSASTGSTEHQGPLASMASEARTASAAKHATTSRPHASRLSPPFGSSAGVRRVSEPSDTAADAAPDSEREVVAAARRD